MFFVKESLQTEVSSYIKQHGENYNNNYITFIVNFLAMFNGGVEERSVICTQCKNSTVTSSDDLHSLRLGFGATHGKNKFSLGDMLDY